MRITLVGPYPPPFGGVASHLVSLVPGLRARGVEDISIISFGASDSVSQENGATLYRVSARARSTSTMARNPVAALRYSTRLLPWRLSPRRLAAEVVRAAVVDKVVRLHRSKVVSFYQSNNSLAIAALKPDWGPRRGVVLTVFGEAHDDPKFFAPRARPLAALLSSADALLSSSRHCARSFRQFGVLNEIEPLYYGVELNRFVGADGRAFRAKHGIRPEATVLLFFGRFTQDMGVDSVIDVAPALLSGDPGLHLVLAGARGPLAERAAAVAQAEPTRITVLHDIPFAAQPELYAASDIVVTPTRDQHACMGMSIKEAMAASRPVIGSAAGGIPEAIVPGETGLLIPLGSDGGIDQPGFVQAALSLSADRARRASMGEAARKRAEDIFSSERTIDRAFEVFRSVEPSR